MRLLFIYFYKTKGTFKEGTTIELSKKYSVIDNGLFITLKKSKNLKWSIHCKKLTLRDYQYQYYEFCTKFNFLLTENDSFQDDFYGDNIDIGAIIGENGTGKSVLINSLREKDNDYSLAVYEKRDGEFVYKGNSSFQVQHKIIINNHRIESSFDFLQIYYSPTQDVLHQHQVNDGSKNISDSIFILNFDKPVKINERIENSDLKNYLNMESTVVKNYVKLSGAKFIIDPNIFQEALKLHLELKRNEEYHNKNNTLNKLRWIIDIIRLIKVKFNKENMKLLFCLYLLIIRDDITSIDEIEDYIDRLKNEPRGYKIFFLNEKDVINLINLLDEKFHILDDNIRKILKIIDTAKELSYSNWSLDISLEKIKEVNFTQYSNTYLSPFRYELNEYLSSGQKAILFFFARLDNAIKNIKKLYVCTNITILLDEADLKLHLEWQRQFIDDLVEFLKSYDDKNFYVLYATHSPMILSDITDDRIVFLEKKKDNEGIEYSIDKPLKEGKSTFGANIYDLYHDSFFMDKYMGEFAFNKINHVINMVNLYKIVDKLNDDKEKEKLNNYERIYNFDELFKSYALYYPNEEIDSRKLYVKREDIRANIENKKEALTAIAKFIGEPLLRNKLEDDLNSMGRKKVDIDEAVETLQGLSQQKIKEKLSKYSESIQMKILKKLFTSGNSHDKS